MPSRRLSGCCGGRTLTGEAKLRDEFNHTSFTQRVERRTLALTEALAEEIGLPAEGQGS